MRRTIVIPALIALAAAIAGCRGDSGESSIMLQPEGGTGVTAEDQSERRADVDITKRIRARLVGDGTLSLSARNVAVITAEGVVTLRGPVNDPVERVRVLRVAETVAGPENVRDHMEVAWP